MKGKESMKKSTLAITAVLMLLAVTQMASAAPTNQESVNYIEAQKSLNPDGVAVVKDIVKFRSCGKQKAEELTVAEIVAVERSADYARLLSFKSMTDEVVYKTEVKGLCKR